MADARTFAARFNQALDALPPGQRPPDKGAGRQQFVARMFHISQKGARKWLEGEAIPRLSRLPQIARQCGVNGEWLLTGQGPMHPLEGDDDHSANATLQVTDIKPNTRRLFAQVSQAQIEGRLTDADIAAIENVVLRLIDR